MELKTIKDVPLISTGTYPLGSGETTFSADDLASAVLAASDPTVVAPRIKLGHTDSRFAADMDKLDGEPAFGVVSNMRLDNNGQTIVGDLEKVPAWLADSMPSAFPGRSIEGGFNFRAPSGRDYKLVISNLALLGTTWPGVTSLDDLKEVLSENGPAIPEPVAAGTGYQFAGNNGTVGSFIKTRYATAPTVTAALDIGEVPRVFAADLSAGRVPQITGTGEQAKWWPRSVQAADDGALSLLIDDDAGKLIRLPFTVSEKAIGYGTPVLARTEPLSLAGRDFKGPRILASFPQPAVTPRTEAKMKLDGQEVDLAVLRARLGLAADADETNIKAALGIGPPTDTNGFAIPPQHVAPVAASAQVPAGMVLIDGAALEQIKAGAQAGETVAARLGEQDRDNVITAGIEDGRIVAASREQWVQRWGQSGEGADEVRKLLTASVQEGGLASVIPVKARETGATGDGSDPRAEAGAHESYMQTFFPQARARLRGEHNGGRVRAGAE